MVMLYTVALQISITVTTVKMSKLCLREIFKKRMPEVGTSLAIQWLRLCTPHAGSTGSIPSQGMKIPTCPHAARHSQKKKEKKERKMPKVYRAS